MCNRYNVIVEDLNFIFIIIKWVGRFIFYVKVFVEIKIWNGSMELILVWKYEM